MCTGTPVHYEQTVRDRVCAGGAVHYEQTVREQVRAGVHRYTMSKQSGPAAR